LTARVGAAWATVAFVAVGGAFAAGLATAPDDATRAGAPVASGPRAIEVPRLERAAALPALRVETPAAATPAVGGDSTGTGVDTATGGTATGGTAVTPTPAPVPEPTPAPAPTGGGGGDTGGGGDPVVGDGL
jgi:hypothetical protein